MNNLAINGNQSSQAFGQNAGGTLQRDAIINGTVLEKLDNNLYLLKIGKHSIEAQIAADLQEGAEYQFVVKKNSSPPELEIVTADATKNNSSNGLTPKEEAWVNQIFKGLDSEVKSDNINKLELYLFLKSIGLSTEDSPEKILPTLNKLLPQIQKVDATSPMLRQILGQTLLFSMGSQHQQVSQNNIDQQLFEHAIKLSGKVVDWQKPDFELLNKLQQAIEQLDGKTKTELKAQLLGLSKNAKPAQLAKSLETIIMKLNSDLPPEKALAVTQQQVNTILKNESMRLVLGSAKIDANSNQTQYISSLNRNSVIAAYQQQAPGLNTTSISSMLDQYISLGGKLEDLRLGDVISAQMAWKGGTPSAMQVHRAGTLLYLAKDLPIDNKNFSSSPLIQSVHENRELPVILDRKLISDPSGSSVSLSKVKEFSTSSKLPNSFHIDKFLQTWVKAGNPLSEVRTQIESIQKWNNIIEEFPKIRIQFAEYLLRKPAFGTPISQSSQNSTHSLSVNPDTEPQLIKHLKNSGLAIETIPKKIIKSSIQALQSLAGSGVKPSEASIQLATWLIGKNINFNEDILKSLLQFQNGSKDELGKIVQEFKQLNMKKIPAEIQKSIDQLFLNADKKDNSLKSVLSFYQSGNGNKLKSLAAQLQHLASLNQNPDTPILARLSTGLLTMSMQSEDYLNGLKQYNIQANRQDTPQLYEIPIAYGEEKDKAWLKIFKRNQPGKNNQKDNYKVVIDLDLSGLGKVRSEVTLIDKNLQLEFLSQQPDTINALKTNSLSLKERFEELKLNANMGFKVKNLSNENAIDEIKNKETPVSKSKIDLSA